LGWACWSGGERLECDGEVVDQVKHGTEEHGVPVNGCSEGEQGEVEGGEKGNVGRVAGLL